MKTTAFGSRLKKLWLGAALAIVSVVSLAVPAAYASGTEITIKNRSDSAYSINVYSGMSCTGTRYVVKPGGSHLGHSTKVNAYSNIYINGKLTGYQGDPNACSSGAGSSSTIMTVYVYPNS